MHRPIGTLVVALFLSWAIAGCSGSSSATPTATAKPIPSPVSTPPVTEAGFTLGNAKLEALTGATTEFGTLGGMNYQIEMPSSWNGRLVMYTHGNDIDTTLQVYPPRNRDWLIAHGYAWASSSYTVNVAYVSGVAADETAALWDFFVHEHGRPAYTYAMGDSMGGAAAFTGAERYGDRYDGVLALCPDAPPSRVEGDFFYAAAYASGVTQAEYDASDLGQIIDTKIKPALRQPAVRARFDALWTDMSGGKRPFVAEGVDIYRSTLWTTAIGNVLPGIDGNADVTYALGPSAGVSSDDFNRGVIRVKTVPGADRYADVNRITGDIKIPTLTVQPTGDALTVFSSSQELRRRVDAKGKGDLLVQRAIQSSQHCFDYGMTGEEIADSFQALVDWVESGNKPDGEDLLGDLTNAGARFTRTPRLGSAAADAVPGAARRITLHGALTLDGAPIDDAFIWAMVVKDGLLRACSYGRPAVDTGRYTLAVAADAETAGCGAQGADVVLAYFRDGKRYLALDKLPWPAANGDVQFDAKFSSTQPSGALPTSVDDFFGADVSGTLTLADGTPAPPGTIVEAYSGDALCAKYVVAPVVLVFTTPGRFELNAGSPRPACAAGAALTLKVNAKALPLELKNDPAANGHELALVVPQ